MTAPRLRAEIARLHLLLNESEQKRVELGAELVRFQTLAREVTQHRNDLWERIDQMASIEWDTNGRSVSAIEEVEY